MFESNELNLIDRLQIKKNELAAYIRTINPDWIIKDYKAARSAYNKAKKAGRITKTIKLNYSTELDRIAAELGIEVNDILGKKLTNTYILEQLKLKYAEFDVDAEKIKYKKLSIRLKNLEDKFKKLKTLETSSRRLAYDASNVLEYYTKKIPHVTVLDSQIKILEEEALIYQVKGLKDNYKKTQEVIKNLEAQRKEISNKFRNKTQINPDQYKAKIEIVNKNPEYIALMEKKRELKKRIADNSASKLIKAFNFAKINLEHVVIDFEDSKTIKIEQDYYQMLERICDLTGKTRAEVAQMSNSQLKKELDDVLVQDELKAEMNDLNLEIGSLKSSIMGIETTEDILIEIFDYENDETDGKIPKEVLVANNIQMVQGIVRNLCKNLGMLHYYDDAFSGGLHGLTVAVNSWYEKQRNYKTSIKFSEFANTFISNTARRELELMRNSGRSKSGSNAANARTEEKQRRLNATKVIDQYLADNPNMVDLKNELIEDLLFAEEASGVKINNAHKAGAIAESDYNNTISGGDGYVDMWALSDYGTENYTVEDMVDAKQTYNSILKSINSLMNLFDIKFDKKTDTYQFKDNRKLMDVYDRKIFLMMTGLEHKRTKNEAEKNKRYTLEDIAEEIVQMKRANGEVNATMAITSVTARWKNIIKKLKIAVDLDPKLKKGLEYMLNYIDNNRSLMEKLSNDREELNIKRDRDVIRQNYKDNEDVMNIEMLDSTRLGDEYELSVSNELDKFENLEL